MQQEHEAEVRTQNETLMGKLQNAEFQLTRKEEELFKASSEIAAKNIDLKNIGMIELSLK